MDVHEAEQALKRLRKHWGQRGYRIDRVIDRDNVLWIARHDDSAEMLRAGSPEGLNAKVIMHFMNGNLRLAPMSRIGIEEEADLAEVRRKHCTLWDFIGQRVGEIGWWASREVGDSGGDETHHVVCRTLTDLDKALTALEAPDEDGALN